MTLSLRRFAIIALAGGITILVATCVYFVARLNSVLSSEVMIERHGGAISKEGWDFGPRHITFAIDGIPRTTSDNDVFEIQRDLQNLPLLESISFEGCPLSDQAVQAIVSLKGLKSLDLRNTNITDASLEYLERLPRLEKLDLRGTKLSSEKLTEFQKIHPHLILQQR